MVSHILLVPNCIIRYIFLSQFLPLWLLHHHGFIVVFVSAFGTSLVDCYVAEGLELGLDEGLLLSPHQHRDRCHRRCN
jgi:hypothetical protein